MGKVCLCLQFLISPFGGIEAFFLDFLTPEDGTTMLSWYFSKELPLYTVKYPRRVQIFSTLCFGCMYLHFYCGPFCERHCDSIKGWRDWPTVIVWTCSDSVDYTAEFLPLKGCEEDCRFITITQFIQSRNASFPVVEMIVLKCFSCTFPCQSSLTVQSFICPVFPFEIIIHLNLDWGFFPIHSCPNI
jgi:hypothetical protein